MPLSYRSQELYIWLEVFFFFYFLHKSIISKFQKEKSAIRQLSPPFISSFKYMYQSWNLIPKFALSVQNSCNKIFTIINNIIWAPGSSERNIGFRRHVIITANVYLELTLGQYCFTSLRNIYIYNIIFTTTLQNRYWYYIITPILQVKTDTRIN